jgi:hypothetical protein
MEDHTWKTKDGRSVHIRKMDTDHIKSCIKFLERQVEEIKEVNSDWIKENALWNLDNVYDIDDYCSLPINSIISSKNDWIRVFQEELIRRAKEDEYE